MKLPEPTQPRAVVFSLGALCENDRAATMAAVAFRQIVARFPTDSVSVEKFGLFCSRFAQVARWYQGQRFYLQRDMLNDARAAGLRALRLPSLARDLNDDGSWGETHSREIEPRTDAYETLEWLREAGLPIAIVSNADSDQFVADLAGTRFAELADVAICSEQAESCLPDPMILYEAMGRLGVRPMEAYFVGTSLELDVRGAQVVGMKTVLLSGTAPCWVDQRGAEPDYVLSTLNEVATLVTLPAPAGGPRVRRRANFQQMAAAS